MTSTFTPALSRRGFLAGTAAAGAALSLNPARADSATAYTLRAAQGRARLVPQPWGESDVWCYGGTVLGPEIRVRQGDRLRIEVENALAEETTVHWHGLRVPNAMDGVPHLTQAPIAPGESFAYEFDAVDAGTFWYHPHQRSFEQVGRGLYGPLIVEEANAPRVDRGLVWVLDDWRLTKDAAIADGFGGFHDMSHAGRLGNTVTINGRVPDTVALRAGERIRLRLINAANARIFALDFGDLVPQAIPPRKNAKPWKTVTAGAVARNEALRASKYLGRAIWRNWSGYHRRSRVETKMHCMKLLGQRLMARDFDRQIAEVQIRIAVMNGYTALGIPVTETIG